MPATTKKFRDCPVPAYFSPIENVFGCLVDSTYPAVFVKISARKVRQFGAKTEHTVHANPEVKFYGQDLDNLPQNAGCEDEEDDW